MTFRLRDYYPGVPTSTVDSRLRDYLSRSQRPPLSTVTRGTYEYGYSRLLVPAGTSKGLLSIIPVTQCVTRNKAWRTQTKPGFEPTTFKAELPCYILNHSARMVRRKIRIMSDRVLVIFNPRSSLLIRVYSPFNPITAVHTAVLNTRPYQVPYYPVPSRYSSTCTSWVLKYSPVPSRYVLSSEYALLVPTSLNPLPHEYERYYY